MSTTGRSPGDAVIEALRTLGNDCRERDWAIRQKHRRSETASEVEHDQLTNHPLEPLAKWVSKLTSISFEDLREVRLRLDTVNGLDAWTKHSPPHLATKVVVSAPDDEEDFLEPNRISWEYRDLNWILPKLREQLTLDAVRRLFVKLRAYCVQHRFDFDRLGLGALELELGDANTTATVPQTADELVAIVGEWAPAKEITEAVTFDVAPDLSEQFQKLAEVDRRIARQEIINPGRNKPRNRYSTRWAWGIISGRVTSKTR